MRFLLDQGLPRSTVQHLAAGGFVAEHVGDLALASASDESILAEARSRQAIVVTLDSDFHAILANSNASSPSVVHVRVQGLKGDAVASLLQRIASTSREDLLAGAAVTVSNRRLAVQRLPLISPPPASGADHDPR